MGRSKPFVDRTMERLRPHLKEKPKSSASIREDELFKATHPLPEKLLGLWEYLPLGLTGPNVGFRPEILEAHDIGFDPKLKRITFPFRDLAGNLAGVVGNPTRDSPDAWLGKYLLYEKELRDLGFRKYYVRKSDYLWRWERVFPRVYHSREQSTVYIVEGFKACLMMVQCGFENTMALMGSSLSDTQLLFLQKLGGKVILCLDDDRAGRRGTLKMCYKLRGLELGIIRYPYLRFNLQPDDLVEDELREAVLNPYSVLQWKRAYGLLRSFQKHKKR